ncbi:unnamed protein product, partial [Brenthis ino]
MRAGAVTWQLPYEAGERVLYELERTLCPDDAPSHGNITNDCGMGHEGGEGAVGARGGWSLHVSTMCAAALTARVRVSRPPVWHLPFAQQVTVSANMSAPRVLHYRFAEGQDSVRLVVTSESELCAVLSVLDYVCPIAQTISALATGGQRLTMMRSGAVQLSRGEYPHGFLAVAAVLPVQAACGSEELPEPDWLWAAALLGAPHERAQLQDPRLKDFTFTVEAALTRAQYAVAAATLLAVFLGFYVVFGALVLAQRWPPLARLMRPSAVLAPAPDPAAAELEAQAEDSIAGTTPARRRRRDSDATFDSSDQSESDEEEERPSRAATSAPTPTPAAAAAPPGDDAQNGVALETQRSPDDVTADGAQQDSQAGENNTQGPFGLPAQLRLAALARRRERTLRARSDRYLYTLYTVAVFYALPVVQFVLAFQIILIVSGSLDICYYNFLCAHRAGTLSDFNHVLSNLGYLLLGALFLLQVRRRRLRRRRRPRHQEYGIPAHYGLLSALGAGMMVVAVLSASYHVCPNRLNFQFDTSFMYVLAVLMMVKIYQSRHPDVNARAHSTFGVLAVLMALVVWGVLGGGAVFWGVFTVLHVFTVLLLSLRVYYVGQLRFEKQSLVTAASELRTGARPLYRTRLAMLLLINGLNWLFAIYGLLGHSRDFAGHMLQVLLGNALVYMGFYLVMKLVHGERLRAHAWVLLVLAAAAWVPSLYFFTYGYAEWALPPAVSRHLNHECLVLQFYDSHDLWHILSAIALYLTFNVLLTWDDDFVLFININAQALNIGTTVRSSRGAGRTSRRCGEHLRIPLRHQVYVVTDQLVEKPYCPRKPNDPSLS